MILTQRVNGNVKTPMLKGHDLTRMVLLRSFLMSKSQCTSTTRLIPALLFRQQDLWLLCVLINPASIRNALMIAKKDSTMLDPKSKPVKLDMTVQDLVFIMDSRQAGCQIW